MRGQKIKSGVADYVWREKVGYNPCAYQSQFNEVKYWTESYTGVSKYNGLLSRPRIDININATEDIGSNRNEDKKGKTSTAEVIKK